MGLISGIVVYLCLWWLVFFLSLPIGVHPPHELGKELRPGDEVGAPVRHHLLWKALAATVIAGLLWLGIAWLINADLISFRGG